jgi:peptide/nickel transport system permease protein
VDIGGPMPFASFLLRRLLWALFLVLAATIVTYLLFWIVPPNAASLYPATQYGPIAAARIRHYLQLDQPIWRQYLWFLWRLVGHGSLGYSFVSRRTVDSIVWRDAPVTASLVLGGAVFWLSLSLPVGLLSALRPRSLADRFSMVFVLVGVSAHPVWIGLILSYVMGYRVGATPIAGYCNFFGTNVPGECGGPVQWAYHLILPWLTFMLLFAALYVRMIRAQVLEALSEDYVRTARAKGASERRVVVHHVLRNCLLPIVTMFGMDVGLAVGGAIFTETVFDLPGLGREAIRAYGLNDMPVITGIVLFTALAVVLINLLVDTLYGLLDPRIRFAS